MRHSGPEMNPGPTVFTQVFAGVDPKEVARAALRFPMPRASRSLSVYDHFSTMIFARLTHRLSLRDIEACLQSRSARACLMGIRWARSRMSSKISSEQKHHGIALRSTIRLNSRQGRKDYPEGLRRISYIDPESGQALVFLTNQFELAALVIAQIYRRRWGIELFRRWLKQHLRLCGFFRDDPNGVRVQIWTALCAYLLVAIAKQKKHLTPSLYETLQVVSVSSLEQIPLEELLMKYDTKNYEFDTNDQLKINYP